MKVIHFLVMAALLLSFLNAVESQAPELPNIGYVAMGYNVYKGNPHCTTSFDPGFGGAAVFNLTYYQHQTTSDGRWSIPDNVEVPGTATVCDVEGSSTTIYFASTYQQSLSVDAQFSMSGFGAAFSASTDYKSVCQSTEEEQDVYVSTQASCQTYLVDINAFVHPVLSDAFYNNAIQLPTTFDPANAEPFWQFLDIVGTHFVNQMIFGSRWGYSFQSTQTQWTTMQEQGIDVDVAASYAGMIKAGVNVNTSSCQKLAKNFTENTQNTYEFSLGNPPPSNGNTNQWQQDSLTSPLMDPLQYVLVNLSNLFTSDYTDDQTLLDLYPAITQALENYCPLHLLPQGLVVTCVLPPSPPPPPPPVGYGALSCGANNDCKEINAAIFCGTSMIEAQEVLLDFCPISESCTIQVSIPYEGNYTLNCLALAVDYSTGAWAWVVGCYADQVSELAVSACQANSGGSGTCVLTSCGCGFPPSANAMWGAIACTSNCDAVASTPNGQGYPSRMEAHELAKDTLASGPNSGYIVIDFDACGALAKGNGGMVAAASDSPQDAENAALNACNQVFGGCSIVIYSCSTSSLVSRGRNATVRIIPNKSAQSDQSLLESTSSTSSSVPIAYYGSKSGARAAVYYPGNLTYLTQDELLRYYS